MRVSRTVACTAIAALFSVAAFAQKDFKEDADKAYGNMQYFEAIDLYKKAYTKAKPTLKAGILFKTAECYRLTNDTRQAEVWYDKAIKAQYNDPVAQLWFAVMKKINEKYAEAAVEFNKYAELVPNDPRGKEGAKACEKAQDWKDNPTRYKVENMVLINSEYHDFSPSYAKQDYSILYFTSTRPGSTGTGTDQWVGQSFSDLYDTKRDKNGKWSEPQLLPGAVNSTSNDGSSHQNEQAVSMFFTRCHVEKKKQMVCKLCTAQRKGTGWDEIVELPFGNDTVTVGHPTLNADESVMYFASDMPGGYGGRDIWKTTFDKTKKEWLTPENLGPTINTAGNEMFPFLHADGKLYFASDGHIGMGGLDIFFSKPEGEKKWSEPVNMQYPINSPGDDFAIIIEKTAERGYFSSNRMGSKGGDDIYMFWLPPLVFTLQGVAYDVETRERLPNTTIDIKGTDGEKLQFTTDSLGHYFTKVNANTTYDLSASKKNYLKDTGTETTVGLTESADLIHDFYLQSTKKVEIPFPEVRFLRDDYQLLPESKDSLDFLYRTLTQNPTIVIELSAHTDSRATDGYNLKLSKNRAKSCVEYLISKGIDAERMVSVGYGEKRLLISDADIARLDTEEEKEQAHGRNRRVVFKVLRDNYVPKGSSSALPN